MARILEVSGITVRSVRLADVGPDGGTFLDPAEHERAAGIKAAAGRQDFLAGRIAQRVFAAGLLGVRPGELTAVYSCPDCGTGPDLDHGRPGYWLDGAPTGLSLSLSRCRGWALLAAVGHHRPGGQRTDIYGPAAIGIDLAHSTGVGFAGFDGVALTPAERRLVGALAPERQALWRAAAWARKEALLKAGGTGLRVDPASVESFAGLTDGTALVEPDTAALGLPEGFTAALAIISGALPKPATTAVRP
ncbi:4'-phosphopantetheinyl transferase family protein [Arthrobacter sp. RHLT1-20]